MGPSKLMHSPRVYKIFPADRATISFVYNGCSKTLGMVDRFWNPQFVTEIDRRSLIGLPDLDVRRIMH